MNKRKKGLLVFKAEMRVQIIFTFDNKDQQMWNTKMKCIPVEMEESEWIRDLIMTAFHKDMHNANDLVKISMCIGCDEKGYQNIPMIKNFLSRNGKYYFQPDQRDIENEIIKGTTIASETKPYAALLNQ